MLMHRVRGLKSSCGILQFLAFLSLPVILFSAHHLYTVQAYCVVFTFILHVPAKKCVHIPTLVDT